MTHRIAILLTTALLATAASAQVIHISPSVRVGGDLQVLEPVEGPLHAAAGHLRVNAPVQGDVRAAAGRIEIGPDAVVGKDASLAGGHITVSGSVKNNLRVAGGKIMIDGPVGGDASVAGGTLELGPNARIAGKLKFRGGELVRDPAAQVGGTVDHVSGRKAKRQLTTGERFMRGWVWTFGLIVLAAIIAAFLPGPSRRMAQELRERPWMTPLLGFIALTTIPVAALLMMVTIIGIPVAVLAMLGYAALLLVGYVWLSVVVGAMLLDRLNAEAAAQTAWRVGAAVVAMLVLAVFVRIPFLGALVTFAALIAGVGMIVAVVMRKTRPATTTPQATTA